MVLSFGIFEENLALKNGGKDSRNCVSPPLFFNTAFLYENVMYFISAKLNITLIFNKHLFFEARIFLKNVGGMGDTHEIGYALTFFQNSINVLKKKNEPF